MNITEADIGPIKPKFPEKLFNLLDFEDVQTAIRWNDDGR